MMLLPPFGSCRRMMAPPIPRSYFFLVSYQIGQLIRSPATLILLLALSLSLSVRCDGLVLRSRQGKHLSQGRRLGRQVQGPGWPALAPQSVATACIACKVINMCRSLDLPLCHPRAPSCCCQCHSRSLIKPPGLIKQQTGGFGPVRSG